MFFDDWLSTDETRGQQRALREFRETCLELEFEDAARYHRNSKVFFVRETARPGAPA